MSQSHRKDTHLFWYLQGNRRKSDWWGIFLPHPSSPARRGSTSLLNTLASPKSFTLGNVQMHLTLLSLNQDFPLLRREGLKAWPAGPVRASKLSPLRGCSWLSTQQNCDCLTHIVRLSKRRGRPCGCGLQGRGAVNCLVADICYAGFYTQELFLSSF